MDSPVLHPHREFSPWRELAGSCRPCEGYTRAGDAWAAFATQHGERLIAVDATGHGTSAADLAERVVHLARRDRDAPAAQLLNNLSHAIEHTEGAAIGVLDLSYERGEAYWTAVGDLTLRLVYDNRVQPAPAVDQCDAQSGVVGLFLPKLRTVSIPLQDLVLLVAASDGVSRSALRTLSAADANSPAAALAARMVQEHGRRYDDATCVVVRLLHDVSAETHAGCAAG